MPEIKPDFSEEMRLPTAGNFYDAEIVGVEQRTGQQSGQPYLNWTLKLTESGMKLFYSTPIAGRGAGMFKHLVRCAYMPNYEDGAINTDVIIGRHLSVKLQKKIDERGQEGRYFEVAEIATPTDSFDSQEGFGV